jgi:AraC-like DNA-binding protein
MKYVILLGAFQAFLALSLFLWGNKKRTSDNLLIWLVVSIFTHLSIKFVIYAISANQTIQAGFHTFIDLAYGPLLWMFAKEIQNKTSKHKTIQYTFFPVFLAAIAYIYIIGYLVISKKSGEEFIHHYNNITSYAITASFMIYSVKALLISRKIQVFWRMEKHLIQFIASLFFGLSLIFLTFITMKSFVFKSSFSAETWVLIRILTYSCLLLISFMVVRYKFISSYKADCFTETDTNKTEEAENYPEARRKQVLTTTHQASIVGEIQELMTNKKLYINPELNLEDLASELNTSRNYISESLNQYLGKSFYQYINEYRIREIVRKMDAYKQMHQTPNILSLAFEVGFNSKSSFNQYFKKVVGLTPSEYLKREPLMEQDLSVPLFAS